MAVFVVGVLAVEVIGNGFFNRAACNAYFALRHAQHLQYIRRCAQLDVACGDFARHHVIYCLREGSVLARR